MKDTGAVSLAARARKVRSLLTLSGDSLALVSKYLEKFIGEYLTNVNKNPELAIKKTLDRT